tara:strand:+ start:6413 stop:6694 length:282 start_codon:yes stop_codon:yes gene_type:complete
MANGEESVAMLKAAAHTIAERGKVYGDPLTDMVRIAGMWSGILGVEIPPTKVPMCMIAVKLSRLTTSPDHADSAIDIAGYAAILRECQKGEGE